FRCAPTSKPRRPRIQTWVQSATTPVSRTCSSPSPNCSVLSAEPRCHPDSPDYLRFALTVSCVRPDYPWGPSSTELPPGAPGWGSRARGFSDPIQHAHVGDGLRQRDRDRLVVDHVVGERLDHQPQRILPIVCVE